MNPYPSLLKWVKHRANSYGLLVPSDCAFDDLPAYMEEFWQRVAADVVPLNTDLPWNHIFIGIRPADGTVSLWIQNRHNAHQDTLLGRGAGLDIPCLRGRQDESSIKLEDELISEDEHVENERKIAIDTAELMITAAKAATFTDLVKRSSGSITVQAAYYDTIIREDVL